MTSPRGIKITKNNYKSQKIKPNKASLAMSCKQANKNTKPN
jgi:hypothetical protein